MKLAAAALLVALGGPQTFSSGVEAVRVDVLVTEGDRPVRGLGRDHFEVRDNGILQQVDLLSLEEAPLNVVLALDSSSSVEGPRLVHLRAAANALLDSLAVTDRAGLVTFSHLLSQQHGLTGSFDLVRHALDATPPSGGTALVDASHAAMLLAESGSGRGFVVVFSDGLDTASWLLPQQVLDVARRSDVVTYAVATGSMHREGFLAELSDATSGRLIEVGPTADLGQTFVEILQEFRDRYVVSYTPRGVTKGGWHRLDVRVKGRRATVRARAGYLRPDVQ